MSPTTAASSTRSSARLRIRVQGGGPPYFFLLMAGAPLTQKDLDGRIEDWFRAKHQLDLEFRGRKTLWPSSSGSSYSRARDRDSPCHLSNKPSSSSTTSGTTSSLMLVSRRNPQHSKRRIEPAGGGNVVDQQCGGSGLHPIRVDHE